MQGVGFRYTCYHIALRYSCTGWVRNLDNGDVEMQIQGSEESVLAVITDLYRMQDGYIRIDDYSLRQIPVDEKENSFRYLY